jgi:hypothetical protein
MECWLGYNEQKIKPYLYFVIPNSVSMLNWNKSAGIIFYVFEHDEVEHLYQDKWED